LENEVKNGTFREDLFYRLNVARTVIPPLRERKEDISILAMSFIEEFSSKFNKNIKRINEEAVELLENYYWKGNIRELKNAIERAILMLEGDELKPYHFSFLNTASKSQGSEGEKFVLEIPSKGITIDVVIKTLILKTLNITSGNQVKAAKILGLSRSKLRYRMEQLGIEVSKKIE
ncbi:MAG TPA: helix-turn-helix domain-containing protein, partial [Ignavibacteriales bacterium]|nr:helix-turn-helix domain-containing protein [Ignavibacteriales bacterium]